MESKAILIKSDFKDCGSRSAVEVEDWEICAAGALGLTL